MTFFPEAISERNLLAGRLVQECETMLSATAWAFYQDSGRGYQAIFPKLIDSYWDIGRVYYCPATEPDYVHSDLHDPKFRQLVEKYNPHQAFLVIVIFDSSNESDVTEHQFQVDPEIPPPDAFAAAKFRSSEFCINSDLDKPEKFDAR